MERMPQVEHAPEGGFDREAVAAEAAATARTMLTEKIPEGLSPEEREQEIKQLMMELAADNGNRFIVEAIAQRLSFEKKALELQEMEDRYPLAV